MKNKGKNLAKEVLSQTLFWTVLFGGCVAGGKIGDVLAYKKIERIKFCV